MRVKTRKVCWCGCETFGIYQNDTLQKSITLICAGCKCERHVFTPGVAVKVYAIQPSFKEVPT